MAPLRRYLRISKYSVLECRIYLDNPGLAQSWLLNPRDPVLPRVIESIRPWVLPKLHEEKERSKKKSTKKKSIKDVVVTDEFEVSLFLTETNTRHSLLTKHKHFRDKAPPRLQSNANKLIGETTETPVDVDAEGENISVLVEEDSGDEGPGLASIPLAAEASEARVKRQRGRPDIDDASGSSGDEGSDSAFEIDSDTDMPPPKRLKDTASSESHNKGDEKKKMAMDVSYEGFAIYGRVLCLVIRRRSGAPQQRGGNSKANDIPASAKPAGQAKMENWISSTQIPVGEDIA